MVPERLDFVALIALGTPPLAFGVLALAMLLPDGLPEDRILQLTAWTFTAALLATLVLVVAPFAGHAVTPSLDLGPLFSLRGYHFEVHFLLDGPALLLLALDYALCGLVGAFSARYLHQDPGYRRFYLLLLLFSVGVAFVAAAAGLDLLFAGWELLGLTSALLVAFFHHRVAPVANALRVYSVYRITDIGLLVALVVLHHRFGSVEFGALDGAAGGLGLVALAVVFGAMGKGAMVPFTGWLPRAMEGPTPSSAIFYGALSIHASPFLLLRVSPLLDAYPAVRALVVLIGLVTAIHASLVGRVQTDVKTSLGYASVAQVSLIWIEVGLGLHTLALLHLGGHALLRTWQLLRAPSQLHDRHHLTRTLGAASPALAPRVEPVATPARVALYRLSLERWYLDELLGAAAALALRPLRWLDRWDQDLARRVEGDVEAKEPGSALLPQPRTATR